jgi:type IV pilus assembly protein PilW
MRDRRDHGGFTIIEVLISTAIFSIVMIAIYLMFDTNRTTYARGENKLEIQQNARVAVEMLARELRMAGYDPSGAIPLQATASAIQVADLNTITFIADITGDNISDLITYRLAGDQVVRDISSWGGAWGPATSGELASSVSAVTFQYFDAGDVEIPAPVAAGSLANIRRITLGVTAQGTAVGIPEAFPLMIDVRVRNAT